MCAVLFFVALYTHSSLCDMLCILCCVYLQCVLMHTICSVSLSALKQVMAAYFQEESIGDVGGSKAKYSPKRGHPGTLVSMSRLVYHSIMNIV